MSGQILVYHDLLGMMEHAHHAKVSPSFCKKYANIGENIQTALNQFREEVDSGAFPGKDYSPYKMPKAQAEQFQALLPQMLAKDQARVPKADKVVRTDDHEVDETIKVY